MLRSTIYLLALCGVVLIAFLRESATKVKPVEYEGFSGENAYTFLQKIAIRPHPIGSTENHRVRDLIKNTLESEGLSVEIQNGIVKSEWSPTYKRMAYAENIVATLKGSDPDAKKVVIACHYDSVMEGPGAADDGYAVASAVEVIKLLKDQERKNDLVLLITDGEEFGLFGAKLYVGKSEMDNIGVMLNYEARGNDGPGIAFEWSENNAWLVDEMSKCYDRPIANSLSFEIYNRMPNSSDFTIFKKYDVPGINHAFIDGFSYYHHPQDDVNNISKNSIQHTGENMYLAAKHFVNYDFETSIKTRNASFYNLFGFFISYNASYDIFLLLISFFLGALVIYRFKKKKTISVKSLLISLFAILAIIVICVGINFGLSALVKTVYPQYSTFYSYHYYNHEWYLIAGVGLSIFISWILGRKLIANHGQENIGVALILLLSLFSLAIYFVAPTGTYIMMMPMAIVSIGLLLNLYMTAKDDKLKWVISFVMLSLMIGYWGNFSHMLYLAFSLNILAAAILPMVLFMMASASLLPSLFTKNSTLGIFGLVLFSAAMISAHIKSKPTIERPLKTNLFYAQDISSGDTYIATNDDYIHEGHGDQFDDVTSGRLPRHMPYSTYYTAADIDLSRYKSTVMRDTLSSSSTVKMVHPRRAQMIHLSLSDVSNIDSLLVDGVLNKAFKNGASGQYYSPMFGIGLDTLSLEIVKKENDQPVSINVSVEYAGLPKERHLPDGMIFNDAITSISEKLEF